MKRTMMTLMLMLAMACGTTAPDEDKPPTNNNNNNNDDKESPLCSVSKPCPTGQYCFNGICALGCQSNANCAADQYCDTREAPFAFCKNKQVPTCATHSDCAASQICLFNLCSAKPPEQKPACNPDNFPNDGCDKSTVCTDPDRDNGTKQDAYCASFPPCSESGTCPVGAIGAVCNNGIFPEKNRFCMAGLCTLDSHCPSNWSCVTGLTGPVGFCSPGGMGMPCTENNDCRSGSCYLPAPGWTGACN